MADMLSKDITALYNDGGTWYYVENGEVNWGTNLYFNFWGTEYRVVNGTVVF